MGDWYFRTRADASSHVLARVHTCVYLSITCDIVRPARVLTRYEPHVEQVEWQKRGLTHDHILLILDEPIHPDWFDEYGDMTQTVGPRQILGEPPDRATRHGNRGVVTRARLGDLTDLSRAERELVSFVFLKHSTHTPIVRRWTNLNVCANFVWYQLRFQNLPTKKLVIPKVKIQNPGNVLGYSPYQKCEYKPASSLSLIEFG